MSRKESKDMSMKMTLQTSFVVATLAALAGTTALAAPKPKMSTPVISCGSSTQTSIDVQVCAVDPGTGAPAGFSIQWMTAADYAANGGAWYLSDDPRLCKASFSGNANLSRYNLAAGECATVSLGEFLFDSGASTNCGDALVCGTEYVSRSFAHANSSLNRSDFTSNLSCSTLACGHADSCTLTQGYWKTHNPLQCTGDPDADAQNPLCIAWPVSSLTLGNVSYDVAQLVSIFNTPAAGNGLLSLAHQLIAAKLNVAAGADGSSAAADIAAADALIGDLVVPPVGSGSLAASATSPLTSALAGYNEGATGPGHCE